MRNMCKALVVLGMIPFSMALLIMGIILGVPLIGLLWVFVILDEGCEDEKTECEEIDDKYEPEV